MKSKSIQKIACVAVALGTYLLAVGHPVAQSDDAQAGSAVLVELFTSQGCASCPPADRFLGELKDREGVIALAWHVDYWDNDGWTDPFSDHAYGERQISYAWKFGNERIYTPQMIIDGRVSLNGGDKDRVRALIEDALRRTKALIRLEADFSEENRDLLLATVRVRPLAGLEQTARIILAITEDNLECVVPKGANKGRTLKHDAVVRWARVVGETQGAAFEESIHVPIGPAWKRGDLRLVAFAQHRSTKFVLAASSIPLREVVVGHDDPR